MNLLVRMAASYLKTLSMHGAFVFSFSFFFFILSAARSYASEVDAYYTNCSHSFLCGNSPTASFINATYPFWGNSRLSYCGLAGFELDCVDNRYAFMDFDGQRYRVLGITRKPSAEPLVMTVARNDLWNTPCQQDQYLKNISMDNNTLLHYSPAVKNLSIFYCSSPSTSLLALPNNISCPLEGHPKRSALFFGDPDLDTAYQEYPEIRSCEPMIKVPVLASTFNELKQGTTIDLHDALDRGFELAYTVDSVCTRCESSGGVCGTSSSSPYNFVCYCSDKPHPSSCLRPGKSKTAMKVGIGIAVGVVVMASIFLAIFMPTILYRLRRSTLTGSKGYSETDRDVERFIRDNGSLSPIRFRYSEVQRMTNSFGEKLGQGGFGSVYKGKLPDGTAVAVKLLDSTKGSGQEFINEVASISRTSHVNVVTLFGFCFDGLHRALIYEFMPNGSLDRFLNNKANGTMSDVRLGWEKLYDIAVGIARGLEYLHRGCNTRILHFDIKPQNILLDANFNPKISDFGLSKLCLNRESAVSMLAARGTIGYIAPEVFSRNFGRVSYKSDVYSYGMMLIEMIGGRDNLNPGDKQSSEIYFADHVYTLIEQGYDRGRYGELRQEEEEIARKIALVGVWCIQSDPTQRPPMSSVIEMLEGTVEALQIPPKPFLFPPQGSQKGHSLPTSSNDSSGMSIM